MKLTFLQRVDGLARAVSPFALTIILVMVGMVPLRAPDLAPVTPSVAIIAIFYWAVFRPDLMPPWAVFLVGLFQDLLGAAPLGVGTLSLLFVYYAVESQRRFFTNATLGMLWVAFALTALGAMIIIWLFSSLVLWRLLDPGPLVLQYLTTIAAYPLLAWLFGRVQQVFVR